MNELENFYLTHKKNVEYALYLIRNEGYRNKTITKKNGSNRILSIPPDFTKILQLKFNELLQELYIAPKPVHGFVKTNNDISKGIVSNASMHIGKSYVINIDIENFFDSINFGRVRGIFLSEPFNTNEKIATKLAQLVSFDNKLPQGAPSSPTISNIICKKMDHELIKIAKEYSLTYSRYADDITFSTHKKKINKTRILRAIYKVVKNNGFSINENKTRVQKYIHTQIVTGLKVNQKVNIKREYIRQIRSMLFSWYKNGLASSADKHFDRFNKQESKYIDNREESFKSILIGKINFLGQVKGKENRLFIKFRHIYYLLRDEFKLLEKTNTKFSFEHIDVNNLTSNEVLKIFTQVYDSRLILTEGVTDVIYIKSALEYFQSKGEFQSLKLRYCWVGSISILVTFFKILYMKKMKELDILNKRKCVLPLLDKSIKISFVMDSDDSDINKFLYEKDFKNYYLLDFDNRGYIEKLLDKNKVIEFIESKGYIIDTSRPELKGDSKKGLEEYLSSRKKSDREIHSVQKTSYIAYKNKIIEKTKLAKLFEESKDIEYEKFRELFVHLEKIESISIENEKLCVNSIY